MASMNSPELSVSDEAIAWSEAHDRLLAFFDAFALIDHSQVARLTLRIFDLAKERHRENPSLHPTTLVAEQAHQIVSDWLAENIRAEKKFPAQAFASGCVALFLSRMFHLAPEEFLASPLPEKWRESMQQALLVTGPDLTVSSMTPRHLDYGPMLKLARQTWHRWSAREVFIALLFWAGVYCVFYWWLSDVL